MQKDKLLIIGNSEIIHIGAHFLSAAKKIGLPVHFCDVLDCFKGPLLLTKFNWWFRGHRPNNLKRFSEDVKRSCSLFRPKWLLSTGIAPIDYEALVSIKKMGTFCINFLTDDPWNPAHYASWFMKTLPLYDHVFSPRKRNIEDLYRLGCQKVAHLPFAYAPELHFPQPPATPEEKTRFGCDIMFAGGADKDRVSYIHALIKTGLDVKLYGGYWNRYWQMSSCDCGHAGPETLRKAVGGAKIALCLIRQANRDGHSMRTFEIPAIGSCMLVEDTQEHREIFGEEGKAVIYFKSSLEMVNNARWLLGHDNERKRLSAASHELIINGKNTYKDRLENILTLSQT